MEEGRKNFAYVVKMLSLLLLMDSCRSQDFKFSQKSTLYAHAPYNKDVSGEVGRQMLETVC